MKDEDGVELTPCIPGLIPWLCSYDSDDGRRAIVLYGSDGKQVLNDNCESLPNLTVDGVSYGSMPAVGPR